LERAAPKEKKNRASVDKTQTPTEEALFQNISRMPHSKYMIDNAKGISQK